MSNSIENHVVKIFQDIAPEVDFDRVDLKSQFRDQITIDSFDFFQIIQKISSDFHISIPDTKMLELNSIQKIVDYIVMELEKKN